MNVTQRGVITLLKSAITGEALPLPEDFDLETAYTQLRKHHMTALMYEGAVNCGISRELPVMQKMLHSYCRALLISEGQLADLGRVFEAFDRKGIDYMPLKGSNMKALYPKPELRTMGDADVLIRLEQRPRFDAILEELGFTFHCETDHELVWKSPKLYLELHKHLINSPNRDFHAYFGTGWQLAVHRNLGLHTMNRESEFLYQFTHFAKHYRSGGIGCRYVLDLWVFLRCNPELDIGIVETELENLGLMEFYRNMQDLIAYWFEAAPGSHKLEYMTDYLFASGSWGKQENQVLSQTVRAGGHTTVGGRLVYLRDIIFPKVETLQGKYTVLKKFTWLYPAVCIYRLIYKLLFDRKQVRMLVGNMRKLNREKLVDRQKMLRYVGLEYHF